MTSVHQRENIYNSNREQDDKIRENELRRHIKKQENERRRNLSIRRQKARRRNVCIAILALCILIIFIIGKISSCASHKAASKNNKNIEQTQSETVSDDNIETTTQQETETVTYDIKAPKIRKKSKINKILKNYAKKDSKMAELYEKRGVYTTDLLNKVINNPEMIDFILEYPNAEEKAKGGFTKQEKEQQYPLLIQWDPRWAYVSYGEDNIGLSGCGPTCLSMVILSLTGNTEATPDKIAEFSMECGYYVEGSGTAWALMSDISQAYNVSSYQIPCNEQGMLDELEQGRMLICSVGPGDFTTAGHFIVIYGYDEAGFLVNDPYCVARSERKWTFETLSKQIRAIWTYRKTDEVKQEKMW